MSEDKSIVKLKLLPIWFLLSSIFFTSPIFADYDCGPAASCASLGKTGNAGDIICTSPCGTTPNTCYTSGKCNEDGACTSDSDCPGNLSCPSGTCGGSVKCNVSGGNCYSNCPSCGGGGGGGGTPPSDIGCVLRTQINQSYPWCFENTSTTDTNCQTQLQPSQNLRVGALNFKANPPCLYGDSGCAGSVNLSLVGASATYNQTSGNYVAPVVGDYTLNYISGNSACNGQFALVHVRGVSCSNTNPGTNQLIGCLFSGPDFNTDAGNAPSGVAQSSPVADNPSTPSVLDFNWGAGSPNVTYVGNDNFSIRWKANLTFKAGTYTFFVGSDDGSRLTIDGVTVPGLDNWLSCCSTWSGSKTFTTQGSHLVQLEYNEKGGGALVSLRWSITDYIIQSLSISPSSNAYQNQPITFTAVVKNQGTAASTSSFTRFQIDSLAPTDISTSALAANATQTLSSTWTATPGSHTITVCADISNTLAESNEANNCWGPVAFTVDPLFTSATCSVSPTSIIPNSSATWSTSVSGGNGTNTYSWSGTDGLTGTTSSVSKTYTTTGTKTAAVTITSGSQTTSPSCPSLSVNDSSFIQTQGGDVHSNTNINTPGGP